MLDDTAPIESGTTRILGSYYGDTFRNGGNRY
jgi:hypothetical protein